jgi:hypothetical protein
MKLYNTQDYQVSVQCVLLEYQVIDKGQKLSEKGKVAPVLN